jgi:hypothetical protein
MSDVTRENILDALAERVADKLRHATKELEIKPRLLSVAQAALYLNRSENSVRHLISIGALPEVRLDGRVFLDVHDLDRAIEHAKQTKPAL